MTLPVSLWLTGGMHCTEYHLVISSLVWVQCMSLSCSLCVHSYISKTISKLHEFSVRVTCGCCLVLLWQQCSMLCSSRFVFALMFCHNGPYGTWHWQYIPGRHAGEAVINFKHILQGSATLFDFVIVYNRSKLCTRGEVHCVRLPCLCVVLRLIVFFCSWMWWLHYWCDVILDIETRWNWWTLAAVYASM